MNWIKSSIYIYLLECFVDKNLNRKSIHISDDMTLTEAGVTEATKIHMMVKKGEGVAATTTNSTSPSPASSSKTPAPLPPLDFFVQLDTFLSKHLTPEQTNKVVNEFRKVLLHGMGSQQVQKGVVTWGIPFLVVIFSVNKFRKVLLQGVGCTCLSFFSLEYLKFFFPIKVAYLQSGRNLSNIAYQRRLIM